MPATAVASDVAPKSLWGRPALLSSAGFPPPAQGDTRGARLVDGVMPAHGAL
jgi:hypothetical protein